jgi:hypothetical protein
VSWETTNGDYPLQVRNRRQAGYEKNPVKKVDEITGTAKRAIEAHAEARLKAMTSIGKSRVYG